eukprot:7379796-Prymnesium_polylepis.1
MARPVADCDRSFRLHRAVTRTSCGRLSALAPDRCTLSRTSPARRARHGARVPSWPRRERRAERAEEDRGRETQRFQHVGARFGTCFACLP